MNLKNDLLSIEVSGFLFFREQKWPSSQGQNIYRAYFTVSDRTHFNKADMDLPYCVECSRVWFETEHWGAVSCLSRGFLSRVSHTYTLLGRPPGYILATCSHTQYNMVTLAVNIVLLLLSFPVVTFSKCSSSSDCLIKSETVVTIRTPERRFSENGNSVCDCLQHSHFLFPKFKFDLLNLFHLSHFFLYVRVLSAAALE